MATGDKKAVSDAKVLTVAEALLASEPRPRQPMRYTGELAKPIVRPAPLLAGKGIGHAFWLSAEEVERENQEREDEINAERERRLGLLFDYYDLRYGDFTGLAISLALGHVPGFQVRLQRRRGRPPKIKNALLLMVEKKKRGKGRPRWLSDDARRDLVAGADKWRETQRALGIKNPSDRGYVRYVCAEHAKANKLSKHQVVKDHYSALVQQLSRSRKVVSKS